MRPFIRPAILTFGLAVAAAGGIAATGEVAASGAAFAQAAAAPQTAPGPAGDAAQLKQIALTPALVDQFLAAKKEIDTVLDKLPDGTDQPDPTTLGKLDTVAKKFKFDDYKQYELTENNIGMVMAGVDSGTKQYIGPEGVIKKQIAEIQADKQISAKDKKDTVDQLNAAMTTTPKLQYQGNIDLVVKNFDKLNEALPQD